MFNKIWKISEIYGWEAKAKAGFGGGTWRRGVLLSCRVLSGWTSGVLPVLLAEEPDTEAWTLLTARAWSGGTYLESRQHKCMNGKAEGLFLSLMCSSCYAATSDVLEVSGAMRF